MATVNDAKAPQAIQTKAITSDYSAERVAMNVTPSIVSSSLSASEKNVRVSPLEVSVNVPKARVRSQVAIKPTVPKVSAERVAMNVKSSIVSSLLSASDKEIRVSPMAVSLDQSRAKAQATITISGPSPKSVVKNY